MSVGNIYNMLAEYQYDISKGTNRAQKVAPDNASFAWRMLNTKETSVSGAEDYAGYLKSRYGDVTVKSVDKDQKSMDALGAGTFGTGNVVVAPNILEQMAHDPEKAAYYEGKIQYYFNSVPRYQAELSAMGHEIHSSGIVIHPDGTVTHYISGDLKPEVRAKIEAQIKAESEEKARRKKQYQELSEEAAEKRRIFMKQSNQKQLLDADSIYIADSTKISTAVTYNYAAYALQFSI